MSRLALDIMLLQKLCVIGMILILSKGIGVLEHESICSLYFKMHLTYILNFKKIETENSYIHFHVLHAHKVVS
jgi:hypothetical protein